MAKEKVMEFSGAKIKVVGVGDPDPIRLTA